MNLVASQEPPNKSLDRSARNESLKVLPVFGARPVNSAVMWLCVIAKGREDESRI
jgi:hypothetical protein